MGRSRPRGAGIVRPRWYGHLVTDRTGAGPIDLAVLQSIDALTVGRPRKYATCSDVLPLIEERIGLGPRYAYDVLVDLARPWVIPVPLVYGFGNIGDRNFPATEPERLGCRPTQVGQIVLDAEAGRLAPVPVGLINGTAYRGGTQPPLEPMRVIATLRHLLDHPRARNPEILELVGPPYSVTDCTIAGDLDALAAGKRVTLRQTGRIGHTGNPVPGPRPAPDPAADGGEAVVVAYGRINGGDDQWFMNRAHLVIESLPPGLGAAQVCFDLADHCRAGADFISRDGKRMDVTLRIKDLRHEASDGAAVRIAIELRPGTNAELARDQLAQFDGITAEEQAAFPAPLARLLRRWAERHRGEDVIASLIALEEAIHGERERHRRHG